MLATTQISTFFKIAEFSPVQESLPFTLAYTLLFSILPKSEPCQKGVRQNGLLALWVFRKMINKGFNCNEVVTDSDNPFNYVYSNERIYAITKCQRLSEFVKLQQNRFLHIFFANRTPMWRKFLRLTRIITEKKKAS